MRRLRQLAGATVAVALAGSCAAGGSGRRPDPPAATGGPAVVSETHLSERILDLTISSPALGRAAWARLLLPTRWSAEPDRRWPVLYLLHGCCDEHGGWTGATDVVQLTAGSDLLVVLPEGGRIGFYSD